MNKHYSVMLAESIELLDVQEDGIYVDGTLGRGGHSLEIAKRLKNGHLYCFDLDSEAIEESKERLKEFSNITYIHDNFANLAKYVEKVDGILLDLGVSSPQFDQKERGFSYRFDGPLDMRMDQSQSLRAADIVNNYSQKELETIFYNYGEEKFSHLIAKKIVTYRQDKYIDSTLELVEIIKSALPNKILNKKGHPAKQTFQALRIAVNGETKSLEKFLNDFPDLLNIGGKVIIITFHSLEDRLVKRKFKELSSVEDDKRIYKLPSEIKAADYCLINHKALVASDEELGENNRSKSAKLRGIKKING